jgi:hypothetical protein
MCDGSEEHRSEAAASARTDDQHVGGLGFVQERLRRTTVYELALYVAGHSLVSELDGLVDHDRCVDLGEVVSWGEPFVGHAVRVLPSVDNDEVRAAPIRLLDRPFDGSV